MPGLVGLPSEWGLIIPSVADGTQPTTSFGVTVTPTQNAYGSYAQIIAGSAVTSDVYGIWINAHSNDTSTAARDTLLSIGLDASGGTSYSTFIDHLLISDAAPYYANSGGGAGNGVWYYFPVFIKAGTSLGARGSINRASGTFKVHAILYCQPSRPEVIRTGSFVQTFGATLATSNGTTVVEGDVSEGAWTELGTLDKTIWGWEYGVGDSTSIMTVAAHHVDIAIGDASNKKIVISNGLSAGDSAERIFKFESFRPGRGVSGDKVYGRVQTGPGGITSGTFSLIAYGVGGGV